MSDERKLAHDRAMDLVAAHGSETALNLAKMYRRIRPYESLYWEMVAREIESEAADKANKGSIK